MDNIYKIGNYKKFINSKIPKYLISSVILLIIFAIAVFVFKENKNYSNVSNKVNLKAAKTTLNWLNTMRSEDKLYTYGSVCSSADCEPPVLSYRSGYSAIWANYKYYQTTGDETYLNITKEDISRYSNRDLVKHPENDAWNCRFMYDLWKSDSFSKNEKAKIESICFDSINDVEVAPFVDVSVLQDIVYRQIVAVLNNTTEEYQRNNTESNSLNNPKAELKFPLFASDSLSRYAWKKDENNLKKAYSYFKYAISDYMQYKTSDEYKACTTGIAAVDFYKVTGREEYKELAEFIFKQQTTNFDNKNYRGSAMCTMLAENLYQLTNKEEYQKVKLANLDKILNNFYDYKGYPNKIKGDGGFYFKQTASFTKETEINGILAGLLSTN